MAQKKWGIAALYGMHETTYLTDPDADGSDYKHLFARELSFQPEAEVIERPGFVNDLTRQPHIIGAKGGKLSFKLEMKASGTPAGSAVAAIPSEASPILESYFGTVVRGTGTTVGVGSTTTNIVVASSAGLRIGMLVEINNEVRMIATIPDATHFTVPLAFTNAPANADIVYASSLFTKANTSHKSLAFVVLRDGIQYTLLGCKIDSLKFESINAKSVGMLAVEVAVGTWSVTSKASLPSASLSGITLVKPPVVKGSTALVDFVAEFVQGVDLDPGHKFEFITTTEGADAKSGIELVDAGPRGVVRAYYAAGHLTDFAAATSKSFVIVVGTRSNGYGFAMGRVQWGQPVLTNRDGMVGEDLPFMANDNDTDADLFFSCF